MTENFLSLNLLSSLTMMSDFFSAPTPSEKLTDYLPSSIHELEEMGADLCSRDSQIDSRNAAEFFYTPSLSPRTTTEIDDVLPVFIVPAFCQTQLKPLISKLMYPCYVAHVHPEASSTKQVASHLLEVMSTPVKIIQNSGNSPRFPETRIIFEFH